MNDSQGVWLDALQELTPKALESGMMRLKQLSAGDKFTEFPPNCLQFKALCLAFYEDLRLPKTSEAYREIKQFSNRATPSWSHPVVHYIASKLPAEFLSIENEQLAYAVFDELYQHVCHLVKQGHPLPPIAQKVVVKPDTAAAAKEVARNHLQALKKQLGAG